jgi:hypothetical protein
MREARAAARAGYPVLVRGLQHSVGALVVF